MGCMLKTLHPVFFYRKVFFPPSKAITPLREDIQKTLFTDESSGGYLYHINPIDKHHGKRSDNMFHNTFTNPFDLAVYHLINGLAGHNRLLDEVMAFFANYALEFYAILFIVAWFALPKRDIQHRHALLIAGLAGVLALIFNVIISHIWYRPRPFTVLPKGTFTQLIPHSQDASFPSDHTSGSFGFAAGSWGHNTKWISGTFTVIAFIVMFSRVYAGVHYPTDVLASLVVGIISGKIMWRFSRFFFPLTAFVARLFKFGPEAGKTGSRKQG